MKRQIMIALDGAELTALNQLAERERRDSRQQAALIIRRALERRGLLKSANDTRGVSNASAATNARAV